MASEPWFKFYAADYLLDARVDSLSLEAQAILLRLWCLCHIEGFCPAEPSEIARKSRLTTEQISRHLSSLVSFFEERDGRLYSHRMEAEKLKSETARRNGQKRGEQIRSASRLADGSADCLAQSQSQSQNQSQGQIQPPPPLKESVFVSKEKDFSQSDFDARDLRELAKARKALEVKLHGGWGSNLTDEEIWEQQCILAGISVQQAEEVLERAKKRPRAQTIGASA